MDLILSGCRLTGCIATVVPLAADSHHVGFTVTLERTRVITKPVRTQDAANKMSFADVNELRVVALFTPVHQALNAAAAVASYHGDSNHGYLQGCVSNWNATVTLARI